MSAWPASADRATQAWLRGIGSQPDEDIDLAEAALLLAALDRPRVALERDKDHVAQLQLETARLGAKLGAESSLECRVEALRAIILEQYGVEQYGYQGDR
jgi:hypothetical protein